jgi:hypothetical protein
MRRIRFIDGKPSWPYLEVINCHSCKEMSMSTLDLATPYTEGYTDARVLLHANGQATEADEAILRIQARYLHCSGLAAPTVVEQAYLAGFHDGASDNFPHPPHEQPAYAFDRAA